MAKALRIVDQNDASRMQPIDSGPHVGFTKFDGPVANCPRKA
jgi:hypothetical protein